MGLDSKFLKLRPLKYVHGLASSVTTVEIKRATEIPTALPATVKAKAALSHSLMMSLSALLALMKTPAMVKLTMVTPLQNLTTMSQSVPTMVSQNLLMLRKSTVKIQATTFSRKNSRT